MKINDLFNVAGKTAVVTGGSRGIGEMITAGLLANGVKVYITARKVGPLIAKAEELSELYNGECIALGCDLSSLEGVENFANQIKEREDSIDFLINNAGAAWACLLYTSDAADDSLRVDLGGRRIIKKR